MELSELNLSVKTFNNVCRLGIKTAEELLERYNADYDKLVLNVSRKSAEEIGDALARHREELTAPEPEQNAVIVSEEYTRAVSLTWSIIANAQAAQQSLYEVCKGLKEMRDGKLYKELGYANFEEYCENEVGIGRRHAYRYMSIADGLTSDFVTSMSQIGTTKLSLLAKLDEPIRQEITTAADVESLTVKELKAKIKELEKAKSTLIDDVKRAETAKNEAESREADISQKLDAANESARSRHNEWLRAVDENTELTEKIFHLEEQVKELESRPIDHVVQEVPDPKQQKRIAELEEQLIAAQIPADTTEMQLSAKLDGLYSVFDGLMDSVEDALADTENEKIHSRYFRRFRDRIAQAERYVKE